MKLFITLDGKAGIAITSDNNIVSIFNGGEKRGLLRTLLPLAIDHGGRKLDNFSSKKLTAMYQMYGVNPISKTKFNSMFAPDDWNYEHDSEPDIVFWIHNGETVEYHYSPTATYMEQIKFVKSVGDAVVNENGS